MNIHIDPIIKLDFKRVRHKTFDDSNIYHVDMNKKEKILYSVHKHIVICIPPSPRRMYPERLDGKSIYYMAQDMTQSTF